MKLTSTVSLASQRNAARPVATFSLPSWSTTQPSSVRMSCGPELAVQIDRGQSAAAATGCRNVVWVAPGKMPVPPPPRLPGPFTHS